MNRPLRFGIIAGEPSGDNLGAGLMQAIQSKHPDCEFEGIGGPSMVGLGFKSHFPMERLSVMGFIEPLGRLPELFRIQSRLEQHFVNNPPDAFIGIDSPGFNIRFEKKLRNNNIKTIHYVSPSVWAYGEKRIKKIKKAVDLMLVLFPFETSIYDEHEMSSRFVGHPLADSIGFEDHLQAARQKLDIPDTNTVITLMPGSRSTEVKRLGPVFLKAANELLRKNQDIQFLLPCANRARRLQVESMLDEVGLQKQVEILEGESLTAIAASDLVLLASGTATLEAMLLKRPMVICYKLAPITHALISRMLKVPNVGLPNLLAGKRLVPEFIQAEVTVENICREVENILQDEVGRLEIIREFDLTHRQLAHGANEQAADAVLDFVQS